MYTKIKKKVLDYFQLTGPFIKPRKEWLWHGIHNEITYNLVCKDISSKGRLGWIIEFEEGQFFINENGTIFKTWNQPLGEIYYSINNFQLQILNHRDMSVLFRC